MKSQSGLRVTTNSGTKRPDWTKRSLKRSWTYHKQPDRKCTPTPTAPVKKKGITWTQSLFFECQDADHAYYLNAPFALGHVASFDSS